MRVCEFCGEATVEGDRRCRACGAEAPGPETAAASGKEGKGDSTPSCLRCGGAMRGGFVAPRPIGPLARKSGTPPAAWHSGPSRWSPWWGYVPWDEILPITAYRCDGCGALEFFARPN